MPPSPHCPIAPLPHCPTVEAQYYRCVSVRRIVLACWGSYGDLIPYLGLAIRLKAAGFAPVLATCPYYRGLVEAEGIEFHPVRPDVDPSDTDLMARVMDPVRGSQVVLHEMVMPFIRQSYDDL